MSSEIIQGVAYDNYDDFELVNFIFSQNFISLFCGLFNGKTHKNAWHDTKFLTLHPNGHETRYYNQLDKRQEWLHELCGEKKNK